MIHMQANCRPVKCPNPTNNMKIKFSNMTLNQRLFMLLALFVAGILLLQFSSLTFERRINKDVVFPSFESQILNGHKNALKSLVDAEAQILALRIKTAKSREEQIDIITTETDPIRFFEGHSGYYFSYDLAGNRINVPINKSQNGQNCLALKDSKGFPIIVGMINALKTGDGFLEYYFEKEGKGIQPKLSYVAMIPGSDFFVGTGVYIDDVQAEREALAANVEKQSQRYLVYMAAVFLIILAVILTVSVLISRSITRLLMHVSDNLLLGAGQVTLASTQLSQTSQALAEGSSEQAASIEETSASLEQASSMTRRNVENVNTAKELARLTRSAADNGASDMQAMCNAMEAIKTSSNDIAKIIKAIDEIAFQTNILALNAAVEAARAGDAGMGFAVVADEVRNLAQRSAQAAKETAAIIESAISKTSQGVAITGKVSAALGDILAKSRQMDSLAGEIATASSEQSEGIGQINIAVSQMDQVTQGNAAHAEENAASAQELNAQAETMRGLVMQLMNLVGGKHDETGFHTTQETPVASNGHKLKKNSAVPARKQLSSVAPPSVPGAATSLKKEFVDF